MNNCRRCNALAERYSDKYGYICEKCFEELVQSGIHTDIEEFMTNGNRVNIRGATLAHFNSIFPKN